MRHHCGRSFLLALLAAAFLSAGVNTPKLGMVRYSSGVVRPVYGVPGSFVIGPAIMTGIDRSSFSDFAGLIASKGAIRLVGANGSTLSEFKSQEESPVLGVSGGPETAVAWLPSAQSILYWDGTKPVEIAVAGSVPGDVTSLVRNSPTEAELLCVQPDNTAFHARVDLRSGTIESVDNVPGASGRTWSFGTLTLSANEAGLIAADRAGATENLKLPDDVNTERMSSSYLHLWSPKTKQDWVLRLQNSRVELWLLPAEPAAEVSK